MEMLAAVILSALCIAVSVDAEGVCHDEYNRLDEIRLLGIQRHGFPPLGLELPTCLPDGTYDGLQCREAMCKCVTAEGNTLIEFQERSVSRNMNCKCIREQHEYGLMGMVGKTFNCDKIGNYERIQCLGSRCYCVDLNGKQQGESVHISKSSELYCY